MFENTFFILVKSSPYDMLTGNERYMLYETKEYSCLSASDWEVVTGTLYKYIKKYGNEEDFYTKHYEVMNNNLSLKPSPATRKQLEQEYVMDGDLFDYDISRIIKRALYDRKYGNTPPIRLPKKVVKIGLI